MSYTVIKHEPEWTEEMFTHCEYSVKEELAWQDSEDGVSTDPSVSDDVEGLYADHEVKDELVLGPTALQPPDELFSTPDISLKPSSDFHSVESEPRALTEEQTYSNKQTTESIAPPATHTGSKLFPCYVRLERCPVLSELNRRLLNNNRKMPQKETSKNHHKPRLRRKYRFKNRKKRGEDDSLSELTKKQNAHRLHLRGAGTSNATFMNGKAYVCKVCMQEFANQLRLNEHARTHKGEFQYACDVCERQFATISYFETHKCKHSIYCAAKMKIIKIANNVDVINEINSDGDLMTLENNKSDVTTPTNTGNIDPGDNSNLYSDLTEIEKRTQKTNKKKTVKAKNSDSKPKSKKVKTKTCNKKFKSKSESGLKEDETKTQNADVKTPKTKKSDKKLKNNKFILDLKKFEIKTQNLDAMKLIKVKTNKKPNTKPDPEVKKAKKKIKQLLQKLKKDPEDAKYVVSYISTVDLSITGYHLLDHNYYRAAQDSRFVDRTSLATYGRL